MLTHKEDEAANRVSVLLLGDEYVIRGADAAEHLARVAGIVKRRLEIEQASHPRLAKLQLAMLVALTLADELAKLQDEHEEVLHLFAEAK